MAQQTRAEPVDNKELGGAASTKLGGGEVGNPPRDETAAQLVDRFALWSGAAGLIPIPFLDIAAVGGVQLQMLRRLSEIYGVEFAENAGKSVIASLAGALIPASTAATTGMGVSSLLKTVPGVGTAIATCSMAAFSAGATWVIGKVFIQHFASGGTLLDFNPPDYREFIKVQKEKWRVRSGASPASSQPTTTQITPDKTAASN